MSGNMSITIKDVLNYPNLAWDITELSANPSITMEDVLRYPEMKWGMKELSYNPSITLNNIFSNPSLKWYESFLATKNYQQYVREMWNRYLDYIISLSMLDLPVYVVLWILDWIDEYFHFQCLRELTKVRMIESVKRFREKSIKSR
jgi:hypothetical protein